MFELTDLDIELKVFPVQFQDSLPERPESLIQVHSYVLP